MKIRRSYTAPPPNKWRVSCRLCGGWFKYAISFKGATTWAGSHIAQHQQEALVRELHPGRDVRIGARR